MSRHDEAVGLDSELRALQDNWLDTNPKAAAAVGRILFKKRKVTHLGISMRETQSQNETMRALRELLSIRNQYMERKGIPDWSSNGEKTVLNEPQRMEVLSQWKEEYHSRPDQIER